MSGIAGILRPEGGPVHKRQMEGLAERLAYRGPHGSSIWSEGNVGLVHVHFRATPEAEVTAATLKRSTHLHVTADVRLDNREDLVGALEIRDPNIPDEAILLAAYERWDVEMLDRIVGDFSFAIWDDRKKQLFCARDLIGIRPFFYHEAEGTFAFASDVNSLLGLGVRADVNEEKVYSFLSDIETDVESTFHEAIRRLLPAHGMIVGRDGRRKVWRYWKPENEVAEWKGGSDREYEEQFRAVFETAVGAALRTDRRPGILLSGGVDSSSIASVARHLPNASGKIPTFTSIFPSISGHEELQINERQYIDDVLALGEFEPHFIRADELSPLAGVENLIERRGEPVKIRGQYMLSAALSAAGQGDVGCLLDGSEGDIVVGYGYDHFIELARAGRWEEFAELAQTYSLNCEVGGRRYEPAKAFWDHGLPVMADRLQGLRLSTFASDLSSACAIFDVPRSGVLKTLGGSVVRNSAWFQRRRTGRSAGQGVVEADRLLDLWAKSQARTHEFESTEMPDRTRPLVVNPMLIEAMESIDPLYAGYNIEARHPFFDRRLMEFCLALPSEQRIKGGWTRSIIRRALSDILPESLQKRVGKSILSVNMYRNLFSMESERLKEIVADDILRTYISEDRAAAAYGRFVGTPRTSTSLPLFRMAALAIWLHHRRSRHE